jgi:hypothetical protein
VFVLSFLEGYIDVSTNRRRENIAIVVICVFPDEVDPPRSLIDTSRLYTKTGLVKLNYTQVSPQKPAPTRI